MTESYKHRDFCCPWIRFQQNYHIVISITIATTTILTPIKVPIGGEAERADFSIIEKEINL